MKHEKVMNFNLTNDNTIHDIQSIYIFPTAQMVLMSIYTITIVDASQNKIIN